MRTYKTKKSTFLILRIILEHKRDKLPRLNQMLMELVDLS
jgi:hypothetical protein